jgi:hypothetical protein
MKIRIDKLDFIKSKLFCPAKDTVKKMNRQTKGWEKIFTKECMTRDCYSKYTKTSSMQQQKKWTKTINRYLTKDTQTENEDKR